MLFVALYLLGFQRFEESATGIKKQIDYIIKAICTAIVGIWLYYVDSSHGIFTGVLYPKRVKYGLQNDAKRNLGRWKMALELVPLFELRVNILCEC